MSKELKVTLIHDWLTGMRGGEKVLELFCRRFPNAPLWTLLYVPGSVSSLISNRTIHSSPLQHLPFSKTKYRHYLPLFPMMSELTKVRSGDLVISSSHAVAKAMVKKNGANDPVHICYIHTPMRYVWDRFDDYFGPKKVGSFLSRFFFKPISKLLQIYDLKTVPRVDTFVANSRFVAKRVERLYGRSAEVLHPPVNLKRFENSKRDPKDWYLMVTALAPYKQVDDGIRACALLGRKLKIVGSGPEEKKLKALALELKTDVEFLGFIGDDKLVKFYSQGRALLFPGVEDFGIVPVEAIASGCPVIAYKEGGILDSMTDKTAVFYNSQTVEDLKSAIMEFEKRTFDERDLRLRATQFSEEKFLEKFEIILSRSLNDAESRRK
jgi:glycosyltransferase involved in cell wall biosynthesis